MSQINFISVVMTHFPRDVAMRYKSQIAEAQKSATITPFNPKIFLIQIVHTYIIKPVFHSI